MAANGHSLIKGERNVGGSHGIARPVRRKVIQGIGTEELVAR
jgi:hypothetical protein